MIKIGITGGVGSGKSRILDELKGKYGAAVYQADLIAHEVQRPGEACYREVIERFGEEILNTDGTIDRSRLGAIVFNDSGELEALNAIVHPAVNARILEDIEKEEKNGCRLFVLEAALLTDKIYHEMLDEIWYIHVEEEVRKDRLSATRGYSRERTEAMMASQPKEAVFRKSCDRVIENSGDYEQTSRQIEAAVRAVLGTLELCRRW
ncbi:dephospho-CoA kinase [Roseburia hominis]